MPVPNRNVMVLYHLREFGVLDSGYNETPSRSKARC
jgi:hypothetical protein